MISSGINYNTSKDYQLFYQLQCILFPSNDQLWYQVMSNNVKWYERRLHVLSHQIISNPETGKCEGWKSESESGKDWKVNVKIGEMKSYTFSCVHCKVE